MPFSSYNYSAVVEHELDADGIILKQEKKETLVKTEDKGGKSQVKTQLSQKLKIDDKSYSVETKSSDGKIEGPKVNTDLSDDELTKFESRWKKLWKPKLPDESTEE